MAALAQDAFATLLGQGCSHCRSTRLRFRALGTAWFETLEGDVVSPAKWALDDEELLARIFRVDCVDCKATLFERDDCPLCRGPRSLQRALAAQHGLAAPKQCPRCGYETLRIKVELRMYVESLHGHLSRRRVESEAHEPGFHIVEARCADCDEAVLSVGDSRCAACGRSSLLKALR